MLVVGMATEGAEARIWMSFTVDEPSAVIGITDPPQEAG
jgi:hypothetical protein